MFTRRIVPSGVDINGMSQVVITTASKSVCLALRGFETCPMRSLFLSEQLVVDSWMIDSLISPCNSS